MISTSGYGGTHRSETLTLDLTVGFHVESIGALSFLLNNITNTDILGVYVH